MAYTPVPQSDEIDQAISELVRLLAAYRVACTDPAVILAAFTPKPSAKD
jgi:hypothetical protein